MANKPAHPNLSLRVTFARLSGRECREAIKHISSPKVDRKTTKLKQKQISGFAFYFVFRRSGPFSCCLRVAFVA